MHSWAFCCRGLGGSGPRGSGQQRGCGGEAGQTWEPLPGSRRRRLVEEKIGGHIPTCSRALGTCQTSPTRQAGRRPLLEQDLFCYAKTSADLGRPLSRCPLASAPLASQPPGISPSLGGAAGLQPFRAVPQQPRSHGHGAGGSGALRLSWGLQRWEQPRGAHGEAPCGLVSVRGRVLSRGMRVSRQRMTFTA